MPTQAKPSAKEQRRAKRKAARNSVNIDLTVVVHFGDEHEPVTLVEDLPVPFVHMYTQVRNQGAQLLISTIMRAASFRPRLIAQLLPLPRRRQPDS